MFLLGAMRAAWPAAPGTVTPVPTETMDADRDARPRAVRQPAEPGPGRSYVPLCGAHELEPGQGRRFEVGERCVALFNVEGTFFATEELCPHSGGPLSEGALDGRRVICSWHYATFDLESGASLDSISRYDIDTFPVSVHDGRVWIEVETSAAPPEAAARDDSQE